MPLRLRHLLCLILLVTALGSCRRADPVPSITLPPTSVLSTRSSFAVVTENLLRIRDKPGKDADVILHVRRGNIVEVVSRTETPEIVEGSEGFWYLVDYSGLKGWVFGAYIQLSGSRAEAEKVAAALE